MDTNEIAEAEDAIAFLERQHEEVRRLFNQVQQAGATDRAEAFQCLVRLLAVHETAEEEVFHPTARSAEGGAPVVTARLEEEAAAKQALAELEKMDVGDPAFLEAFDGFRVMVDRHATNEETEEFPLVRASNDPESLKAMGEQLRLAESIAPTHPHPHGPESALGNLVVGPFVAIADRVRDALKGK